MGVEKLLDHKIVKIEKATMDHIPDHKERMSDLYRFTFEDGSNVVLMCDNEYDCSYHAVLKEPKYENNEMVPRYMAEPEISDWKEIQ